MRFLPATRPPRACKNATGGEGDPILEHRALLIHPWTAAPSTLIPDLVRSDAEMRSIRNADNDLPLGFALRNRSRWPSFFSWFAHECFQIFESDDASLLATATRPFGLVRHLHIFDAEDRHVGSARGPVLLSAEGASFAQLEIGPGEKVFRTGGAVDLAWVIRAPGGATLLHFNEEAGRGPFVRMVILARVIGGA